MRASWVTIKHNKKLGRDQVRVAGLGSVQKTVYISIYIYAYVYIYMHGYQSVFNHTVEANVSISSNERNVSYMGRRTIPFSAA